MTLGPARRFIPICVRHPHGFIGGPSGYVESETAKAPIIVEHEMSDPLYSVGTWDSDCQAYTPQIGVADSINITLAQLRRALKRLRALGYNADRVRLPDGEHDSDPMVLVERTDGKSERDIMEDWKR